MFKKAFTIATILVSFSAVSHARVHWNKRVGTYDASQSVDLREYKGQTFLNFMKAEVYPRVKSASTSNWSSNNLRSISRGLGVEIKLSDDVTTIHVDYKRSGEHKADKSGRSFGVVHDEAIVYGERVEYIADASYKHYLRSLEKILRDEEEAVEFYSAILKILLWSDPSGINDLDIKTKRVAADFVAVYVAEQYRRLLKHDGEKLAARSHRWDDAHLQVTLLANFHAGQDEDHDGMFYGGRYTTSTYVQKETIFGQPVCPYRQPGNDLRSRVSRGDFNLTDYWQFSSNCKNSGVNITRRDFRKMNKAVTRWMNNSGSAEVQAALGAVYVLSDEKIGTRRNVVRAVTEYIVNDRTSTLPSEEAATALTEAIVMVLTATRDNADSITRDSLL